MSMTLKSLLRKSVPLILIFALVLSFGGCSKEKYKPNVYKLSEEQEAYVVNPTPEFVMAALNITESVTNVLLSDEAEEGYKAKVYFVSSFIDASLADDKALGTQNGGSVEIFESAEEALKRDEYLHNFDNTTLVGQSHAVAGSLVIRTSSLLDAYNRNYITDRVVYALTCGKVTNEIAEKTMSDYLKTQSGLVRMPFSSSDLLYENYANVESKLKELGFSNIKYDISEMDYNLSDDLDGSVVSVSISDKTDFSVGDTFSQGTQVVISYVCDKRIAVPKSSADCEGMLYNDVATAFLAAGFKNVEVVPIETAYNEADTNGGVIAVIIDDTADFDSDAKFLADATVTVNYVSFSSQGAPSNNGTTSVREKTEKTTQKSTEKSATPSSGTMVWVPTKGGTRYHSKATCSNMKNPKQVTVAQAQSQGFSQCKRCF